MLVTMGTSPVESVVASGNIFIGQVSCKIKKTKHLLKWILFPEREKKNVFNDSVISFTVGGRYQDKEPSILIMCRLQG